MSGAAAPDGGDSDERITKLVHDLRTPLTIITGFAELLERQRDALTAEQREGYIARISAAAHEMSAILDAEREHRLSGA